MDKREGKKAKVEDSKEVKGASWLNKKIIPKGTSPLSDFDDGYQSSEDVYEGFLSTVSIIITVLKSIKDEELDAIVNPFQGSSLITEVVVLNKLKDLHLKFRTSEQASQAFKTLEVMKKTNSRIVRFCWAKDPKYKTYCITKFSPKLNPKEIDCEVRNYFRSYGDILKIVVPPEKQDMAYLYISLREGVKPETVLGARFGKLQVRECEMKGHWSKTFLPQFEIDRQKILQR